MKTTERTLIQLDGQPAIRSMLLEMRKHLLRHSLYSEASKVLQLMIDGTVTIGYPDRYAEQLLENFNLNRSYYWPGHYTKWTSTWYTSTIGTPKDNKTA